MIGKRLIGLVYRVCFLSICLPVLTGEAAVSFTVYPGPGEDIRSPRYVVDLSTDGETFVDSFVYVMENHIKRIYGKLQDLSDANHFTIFDITGSVTARITDLKQDIQTIELLPERYGGKATITGTREVTVQLEGPGYYYLEINGEEGELNPLFLFADPPQTNIPNANDPKVHYFEAGYHDVGIDYEIGEGETLYLEGGAFLHGNILVTVPANTRIAGRGIISGRNYQVFDPPWFEKQPEEQMHHGIDYKPLYVRGNNQVEGVTIIYPAGYATNILNSINTSVRNIKCLAWRWSTDGIENSLGGQSTIRDVFLKVNDDNVKFWASDAVIDGLIVWHQSNAAVFTFGYNMPKGFLVENRLVRNVDILRKSGIWMNSANSTFCMPSFNGAHMRNITFENVTVYDDVASLFGFSTAYLAWQMVPPPPPPISPGKVENFRFRNIDVRGTEIGEWWVDEKPHPLLSVSMFDPAFSFFAASEGSYIRNFSFENLRIDGKRIKSLADFPNGGAIIIGDVSGFTMTMTSSCLDCSGDLSISVPCAEYYGNQYGFTLVFYHNPDDPSGYYWKMDMATLTGGAGTDVISVGSDLSMYIPCVSYNGAQYGFTLIFYNNPYDPSGLYWKMDMGTLEVK